VPLPGPLRAAAAAARPRPSGASGQQSEPGNASALASKAKPACKLPGAHRSAVAAGKPLLSVLERRKMPQPPSKPLAACGAAAAAAKLTQQQPRMPAGKATAKQPVLKHAGELSSRIMCCVFQLILKEGVS
jgi:hypothetical protein